MDQKSIASWHLTISWMDSSSSLRTNRGLNQSPRPSKKVGKIRWIESSNACANPPKGTCIYGHASTSLMARSARRAMIVDLALSVTGSQLIASVLPTVSFLWRLSSSFPTTYTRRIKTKGRYYTSAFGDTSSHFEDARPVLKLFGYCVSFCFSIHKQLVKVP